MRNNRVPLLAYKDQAFLDSDDARGLRILSEYLGPLSALRHGKGRNDIEVWKFNRRRAPSPRERP